MTAVIEDVRSINLDLINRIGSLEVELLELKKRVPENKVSIILLSGDFDKAVAAFFMANGAVAMGMEVTMFFTFWGCTVIKKGRRLQWTHPSRQKSV